MPKKKLYLLIFIFFIINLYKIIINIYFSLNYEKSLLNNLMYPVHNSFIEIINTMDVNDYRNFINTKYKVRKKDICNKWKTNYINYLKLNKKGKITYLCLENNICGGFSDRMMGMLDTFMYALLNNMEYGIYWENFNDLNTIFENKNILSNYTKNLNKKFEINLLNKNYNETIDICFKNNTWIDKWDEKNINIYSNRGLLLQTLYRSEKYKNILNNMGINKNNIYKCFIDTLFKPNLKIKSYINVYKNLFDLNSTLSIGIQIRSGDYMFNGNNKGSLKVNNYMDFFECANNISNFYFNPKIHKRIIYFVVTDSYILRKTIYNQFHKNDFKILITGLPITHIDFSNDYNGTVSAIIENFLLSYTDYRVLSYGGYGKLSAFYSGNEKSNYYMINQKLNCENINNYTSFDILSSKWSLG